MRIRCVVTGWDASGKSVIVKDAGIEPVTLSLLPGFEFHRIWGADSTPKLPSDGTPPPQPRYFPPAGGFRFAFFVVAAHTRRVTEQIDATAALPEVRDCPGCTRFSSRRVPAFIPPIR
jgi:hypothetical protein